MKETTKDLELVTTDYSTSDIGLGDYIRLKKPNVGDIIYLKDRGFGVKIVVIGNATPYEGVSYDSHEGWDWEKYNAFKVMKVISMLPIPTGSYLCPEHFVPA